MFFLSSTFRQFLRGNRNFMSWPKYNNNLLHVVRRLARQFVALPLISIALGLALVTSANAQLAQLPESPAYVRDTHLIENGEFTRPHQPAMHTTRDGRVALGLDGVPGVLFRLYTPEKLNEPFTTSAVGIDNVMSSVDVLERSRAWQIPRLRGREGLRHIALCEAPASETVSGRSNPRVCNGSDDCYDFTVIAAARPEGRGITLVGTETTVRVENPKTVNARIAEVTTGEQKVGATFPEFKDFFEALTPADGRIIIGRIANSPINWTDERGRRRSTNVNNVYLVNDNPDAFESCDVRQFDKVYPLTNAPYDNTINTRYGFAMHPFRDSSGTVFADDKGIGSYPWVDREANNIAITTLPGVLFDRRTGVPRFPARCPTAVVENLGGCLPDRESDINSARLQGRAIMGLWTQGKLVTFDNVINNMDFGLGTEEKRHRDLRLYSASDDHDGWVRVGGGRNGSEQGGPLPRGTENVNFFDSLEHRLNMYDHMQPVTTSDVAWVVSGDRRTLVRRLQQP